MISPGEIDTGELYRFGLTCWCGDDEDGFTERIAYRQD